MFGFLKRQKKPHIDMESSDIVLRLDLAVWESMIKRVIHECLTEFLEELKAPYKPPETPEVVIVPELPRRKGRKLGSKNKPKPGYTPAQLPTKLPNSFTWHVTLVNKGTGVTSHVDMEGQTRESILQSVTDAMGKTHKITNITEAT
jgi:hypothetical protein